MLHFEESDFPATPTAFARGSSCSGGSEPPPGQGKLAIRALPSAGRLQQQRRSQSQGDVSVRRVSGDADALGSYSALSASDVAERRRQAQSTSPPVGELASGTADAWTASAILNECGLQVPTEGTSDEANGHGPIHELTATTHMSRSTAQTTDRRTSMEYSQLLALEGTLGPLPGLRDAHDEGDLSGNGLSENGQHADDTEDKSGGEEGSTTSDDDEEEDEDDDDDDDDDSDSEDDEASASRAGMDGSSSALGRDASGRESCGRSFFDKSAAEATATFSGVKTNSTDAAPSHDGSAQEQTSSSKNGSHPTDLAQNPGAPAEHDVAGDNTSSHTRRPDEDEGSDTGSASSSVSHMGSCFDTERSSGHRSPQDLPRRYFPTRAEAEAVVTGNAEQEGDGDAPSTYSGYNSEDSDQREHSAYPTSLLFLGPSEGPRRSPEGARHVTGGRLSRQQSLQQQLLRSRQGSALPGSSGPPLAVSTNGRVREVMRPRSRGGADASDQAPPPTAGVPNGRHAPPTIDGTSGRPSVRYAQGHSTQNGQPPFPPQQQQQRHQQMPPTSSAASQHPAPLFTSTEHGEVSPNGQHVTSRIAAQAPTTNAVGSAGAPSGTVSGQPSGNGVAQNMTLAAAKQELLRHLSARKESLNSDDILRTNSRSGKLEDDAKDFPFLQPHMCPTQSLTLTPDPLMLNRSLSTQSGAAGSGTLSFQDNGPLAFKLLSFKKQDDGPVVRDASKQGKKKKDKKHHKGDKKKKDKKKKKKTAEAEAQTGRTDTEAAPAAEEQKEEPKGQNPRGGEASSSPPPADTKGTREGPSPPPAARPLQAARSTTGPSVATQHQNGLFKTDPPGAPVVGPPRSAIGRRQSMRHPSPVVGGTKSAVGAAMPSQAPAPSVRARSQQPPARPVLPRPTVPATRGSVSMHHPPNGAARHPADTIGIQGPDGSISNLMLPTYSTTATLRRVTVTHTASTGRKPSSLTRGSGQSSTARPVSGAPGVRVYPGEEVCDSPVATLGVSEDDESEGARNAAAKPSSGTQRRDTAAKRIDRTESAHVSMRRRSSRSIVKLVDSADERLPPL